MARDDGERAEGAAPRPCPGCATAMRAVTVGALVVEECPACDGLWLAAADFERLCADQEAQAAVLHQASLAAPAAGGRAALPPVRYRPCPACGAMMNRHNFGRASGVVLDVCRPHGTFFDRAELHGVVRFIRGGGLERARERQRERWAEEERRARAREVGASVSAAMRPTPAFRDGSPTALTLDLGSLLRLFAGD